MRVLVCGGRRYGRRERVFATLDHWHRVSGITLVIHGDCPTGADRWADEWARARGIPVRRFPAAWHDISHPKARVRRARNGALYDAAAGPRRNREMLDASEPDVVLAFPGDTGTADMMAVARRAGVRVIEVM